NIQGFELDYVGVIWGRDLRYDLDNQTWIGDKKQSADSVVKRSKDQFVDLVKNTYRVLLSRGMAGCYVHFMDKDTERFVRSRMESLKKLPAVAQNEAAYTAKVTSFEPRIVHPKPTERYFKCVPLVPLKAAAGAFGDPQHIPEGSFDWVAVETH